MQWHKWLRAGDCATIHTHMNVERNRRMLLAEVTATFAITTRYSEYIEISSSSICLYLSCSSFAGQGLAGTGSVGTREWYCLGL